jgi:hypothetical protein
MGKSNKRVVAMDPGRLRKFIDGSGLNGGNSAASLLDYPRPASVYDPSISWDGLSVDPRPFSRFDARPTKIPPGAVAPTGMTGSRVIPLDGINDGTVFNPNPTLQHQVRAIPETAEQMDTKTRAIDKEREATVVDEPGFRAYHLTRPLTRTESIPDALIRGGPQANECLLNPKERRQIMEFEHRRIKAAKMVGKADGAANRLDSLMKTSFKAGALGVDSVKNLNSGVYGELGRTIERTCNQKFVHETGRRDMLTQRKDVVRINGYHPFHHNETVLSPRQTKVVQTRNRTAAPVLNTHERLFVDKGIAINAQRTQKLRNETLAGKDWNITTNTLITDLPSNVPFRNNKLQAHPSQATMQRGRNMQGFLDFSQVTRCTSPFLPP